MAASTLLQATGLRTHAQLERPFERLSDTSWALGLHGDHRLRLWHGWRRPRRTGQSGRSGIVSGLALAQAMIHEVRFTVSVNVGAMARFRSRYSALIYSGRSLGSQAPVRPRAEADPARQGRPFLSPCPWTSPPGAGHRFAADGGGLECQGVGRDAKGGPVHEDLASAGLRLRTEWVMAPAGYGARQVPTALRLTVSRIAGAERRPPDPAPASVVPGLFAVLGLVDAVTHGDHAHRQGDAFELPVGPTVRNDAVPIDLGNPTTNQCRLDGGTRAILRGRPESSGRRGGIMSARSKASRSR